jgi:hypothetical protein
MVGSGVASREAAKEHLPAPPLLNFEISENHPPFWRLPHVKHGFIIMSLPGCGGYHIGDRPMALYLWSIP